MTPEQQARERIDNLLEKAGWVVQDYRRVNLSDSLGVAVREFPLSEGIADYLLFVNRVPVGVIEAKPEGTTLSGVAEQTAKYILNPTNNLPIILETLPFAYESTGTETFFRNLKDPEPRSRRVFAFHQPKTLLEWFNEKDTLRGRLKKMPPLYTQGLRECQIEAIKNLEKSLSEDRPRALIQMASGGGKTFTAVSFIYRLIKFANARRVLFLVDRSNLGRQTRNEFQQYITPDDGRKFTELYNIQHLTSNTIDPVSRVCITTIQRLYSMLKGETEFSPELEEFSGFEYPSADEPKEISYNPQIPIETFDFIVTDECHRSIYHIWRQVLEYFDAYIIGLTATPSKQTLGFFNQNLVMEYSHERAVADGVNVGYDVYRIKTEITEKGSKVEAGFYVDKRDKLTRQLRWEQLDEDLEYTPSQLDRDIVAPDQIRTIIKTFKEKLFTELFPGRTEVPKTLIFAKDDSHAEDIVHIVREEFGKGNDFCKKITYRTTGEKPEDLIVSFRNSYNPRIAVTVDMISTGTDIRPLECLIFMRDVKSRVYFEQMKGRGTRVISPDDLQAVTPDALHKTHFIIVDAVGVCENDKTDSRPLERKRSIPFDKLIHSVALGNRDEDTLSSLVARLSKLDRELNEKDRREIEALAGGRKIKEIINRLIDAIDPDKKIEKAKEIFNTDNPSNEQIKNALENLVDEACKPFDNPDLREILITIKKRNEQIIDTISKDRVILAGFDDSAKEKAKTIIDTFKRFIEENKDELIAIELLYKKPYGRRHITYEEIKRLADAIQKPPYYLTTELVWKAYEQLERSKVKKAGPQRLLTDIISLLRFTLGSTEFLEPFPEIVEERFSDWLREQQRSGKTFTPEQLEWLTMIKDHIATSCSIELEDFDYAPFYEKGGLMRFHYLFGTESDIILEELNEVLVG
ncbi:MULTISPECIES: type I restriction-modification enzyme R subunit C-terminal domain-containing protein [Thermodesulfovibrio]|uniref:Type I site-specific deoxyribonuclease n=1 Tax=Thermodesulfovibrio yellowstonii (strain ATCC 51303 / DSM 11347 / YP87) TaxID=289376 RepID=B5YGZ8_THEYD|nr:MULTISPECIES: type I restriction-modification enzyme R subunit C-terminal domain-containing protein [Thermodesulfovibrio]ACI22167.1 type I site-specific deoxyribonuclease [Thermodesulfovibrio yellowstonii DSM 11347]MDI6864984.1 type I restriction-modification enzyme R subunit C-terminal domain-containing protein [Thermodesulfovibrio yellowstonii]